MSLEKINVDNNLFLAPMAEITDYAFRKIAKENGAGLTFTQMVSAEGIIKNNFNTLRMLTFGRNEKPIGVQLLGNDPDILGAATRELVKFKPNIIDLNCGCPVDKVFSNKMGAYLLYEPENIGKLVKKMVHNSGGIPISVKIRLGAKDKVNAVENAKVIEENGASLIIVHARTRREKYDVFADWEWIKKIKESVTIPVIGNGSIFTAEDAVNMINDTKCDGVLLARGTLGNPFIFNQILALQKGEEYTPTLNEIGKTVLYHIELLEKEQGLTKNLDRAKKNIIWYFKYFNGIWNLIEQLYSVKSFEEIKKIVAGHIIKLENNYYPEENTEEISRKFKNKVLFWLVKEKEKIKDN